MSSNPIRKIAREGRRLFRGAIRNPYETGRRPSIILHGTYHKCGTVWFGRVLKAVAKHFGLKYAKHTANYLPQPVPPDTDIYLSGHSIFDYSKFNDFRGSHMIRDPRDVVVSGYNYHLWTDEPWANEPLNVKGDAWRSWGFDPADGVDFNENFKQLLNKVDLEAGYRYEIMRYSGQDFAHLKAWDYDDPRFYEIRYEDIMADEDRIFRELFAFYGFTEAAIEEALEIARGFSFRAQTKRDVGESQSKSHLRSGKSGQWRSLPDSVVKMMQEAFGPTLIRLGYESDLNWE